MAALRTGSQAIHPGVGFLSENADFARAVQKEGLIFIGPDPDVIDLLGDKVQARNTAKKYGLPITPGTEGAVSDPQAAIAAAEQLGFPVIIKAAAGGGGKGMRIVRSAAELPENLAIASREALANFADGTVFIERYLENPRHVELQIIADGNGTVLVLGERDCSVQKRHQKLIEESPSPGVDEDMRRRMTEGAVRMFKELKYRGAGTIEFLVSGKEFYFMEVNARIQVEHPVTEMVTGIDLVKEQLRLALGEPLGLTQKQVVQRGAAIEARILAEDSEQGFLPSIGQIVHLKEPGGPGVRVDSHLYTGMQVTTDYDSLLAKVIVWDHDRPSAIKRLRRALQEFQISGVATDQQFLLQLISSPDFVSGNVDTTYLEHFTPQADDCGQVLESEIALAAAIFAHRKKEQQNHQPNKRSIIHSPWQAAAWLEQMRGNRS